MWLAYDGDGEMLVDAICMCLVCRMHAEGNYIKCLHFQEMPQVPVAILKSSTVSALAAALVQCANRQRPGADRSHCLAASPATGAAARFLLAPVVGLGNAGRCSPTISFLAMASVNRAPLPSCRSWIMDHGPARPSPGQSRQTGRQNWCYCCKVELQPQS